MTTTTNGLTPIPKPSRHGTNGNDLTTSPTGAYKFPATIDADTLQQTEIAESRILVHSLLAAGDKATLCGGSKSNKTWILLQWALAMAQGTEFLGLKCETSNVLFVNLELKDATIRRRIIDIRKQIGDASAAQLHLWNLRGHTYGPFDVIFAEILLRAKEGKYDVVIIDPIYKFYGELQENNAADMAKLFSAFDRLATESGAAVIMGHHFSKGNQASKEAIDRSSGSGVFGRDPDVIITVTPLDESEGFNAFSFEAACRDQPPLPPFGFKREHPLIVRCDDLNPSKLKRFGGRPSTSSVEDIVDILEKNGGPMTYTAWAKACSKLKISISKATFARRHQQAISEKLIKKAGKQWVPSGYIQSPTENIDKPVTRVMPKAKRQIGTKTTRSTKT